MQWNEIKTAPKDGSQILLAKVDEDGAFGVRHGFYENSPPSERGWYDIDGEKIWEPQFWCAVDPLPPGAKPVTK